MISASIRPATPADTGAVALLHADSWRRHYRGAYSDAFLDGDVAADRLAFWSGRIGAPGSATFVAEDPAGLAGFVHVRLGDDPRWGALVGNLHVAHDRKRQGLGSRLLAAAAGAVGTGPLYLWVLEQNVAAQAFYRASGGTHVETVDVVAPGPGRLAGRPRKLRMHWPDCRVLTTR